MSVGLGIEAFAAIVVVKLEMVTVCVTTEVTTKGSTVTRPEQLAEEVVGLLERKPEGCERSDEVLNDDSALVGDELASVEFRVSLFGVGVEDLAVPVLEESPDSEWFEELLLAMEAEPELLRLVELHSVVPLRVLLLLEAGLELARLVELDSVVPLRVLLRLVELHSVVPLRVLLLLEAELELARLVELDSVVPLRVLLLLEAEPELL